MKNETVWRVCESCKWKDAIVPMRGMRAYKHKGAAIDAAKLLIVKHTGPRTHFHVVDMNQTGDKTIINGWSGSEDPWNAMRIGTLYVRAYKGD